MLRLPDSLRAVRAARSPRSIAVPPRVVVARTILASAAAVLVATVVVALLEGPPVGMSDASPVYFVAVAVIGATVGTWPAVGVAVASFLVYDLLFTLPRYTLTVEDPREWLDLLLFLALAVIVGRLSALGSERAVEATRRADEASALFATSRTLATAADAESAAPQVLRRLVEAAPLRRAWLVRDAATGRHVVADTSPDQPIPRSSFTTALVRTPGDAPARWVRAHEPGATESGSGRRERAGVRAVVRVRLESEGVVVGSLFALPEDPSQDPDRITTRLLSLAADQLALAFRRDELRRDATETEIARRADGLKTALLNAVSHDLRTPLASIRAAAGTLSDPDVAVDAATARATGTAIDAEADRLDRLVREVLDLSRIEGGSLRPDPEPLVLGDAVTAVVDRLRPALGDRSITVDMAANLPPVRADGVLLDTILTNLVDNVARHTSPPAPLRITGRADADRVRIDVEDGGRGVPADGRPRLFQAFDPERPSSRSSRPGLGLGLAIVRGMAEAMGGTVEAAESGLGGLRVSVELPAAGAEPSSETGGRTFEGPG